jgi:pantoate--beta-alanine ligase
MVICKTVPSLREYLASVGSARRKGFIPTMGALHEGHASLIREAKTGDRFTVCSIFVNPTQFNDPADFAKYPKTLQADIGLLEKNGVDVLFLPSVEEMYPDGTGPVAQYDLGYLETILEGKYRPGHFQGVCQIVERLLRIVRPDDLYLGQKDYQQCLVLRRLIELQHLPVSLIICPTRRETSGLAMSSRNMRLDEAHRKGAVALYETLNWIRSNKLKAPPKDLEKTARERLEAKGFRVDYVEIAAADTLRPLERWGDASEAVALVAAFSGDVRLIDNELLNLS